MNNSRINDFLDNLLGSYQQTPELLEQKEELMTHLTERTQDHMAKGLTYDQAFEATIRDLGDVKALVAGIAPRKQDADYSKKGKKKKKKKNKEKEKTLLPERIWLPLVSLSPFIYLILGILFGWWAWAWVIIPLTGILCIDEWKVVVLSATPFIYYLLGWFLGWWAWGWLIIPVAAILLMVND